MRLALSLEIEVIKKTILTINRLINSAGVFQRVGSPRISTAVGPRFLEFETYLAFCYHFVACLDVYFVVGGQLVHG